MSRISFFRVRLLLSIFSVACLNSARSQSECAPEAMSRCTDPLKVVTDNKDLGFATSIEELQEMCPKLMEGLRCIDDFTLKCLDREHRAYFNTLYAGTTQVIIDLCQEGEYQTAYLKHAPCMRNVQNGYEKCAAEYQVRIKNLNEKSQREDELSGAQPKVTYDYYDEGPEEDAGNAAYDYEGAGANAPEQPKEAEDKPEKVVEEESPAKETPKRSRRQSPLQPQPQPQTPGEYVYDEAQPDPEENVRLLCCSFQRYLHCSESVVNQTCGYETAKFTKGFLDRMSGPLIQGHCKAYEYNNDGCDLFDKVQQTEYANNNNFLHYSKTAAPFSASQQVSQSWKIVASVVTILILRMH